MNKPKILFLDIETAPNRVFTWAFYEQTVIKVEKPWYILGFSAQWQGQKVFSKMLPDYQATWKRSRSDDRMLVKDLWNLLEEADYVVAHNGDGFDLKKIKTRFIGLGLTPPSKYKTIDTLKIARKEFKFLNNKLDYIADRLGIGRKLETGGKELWFHCMEGDPEAWKTMREYNENDVVILEQVYQKFKPYITNLDISHFYENRPVCTHCGSQNLVKRGTETVKQGIKQIWHCKDCGARPRSKEFIKKFTKPIFSNQ